MKLSNHKIDKGLMDDILRSQENEITEHIIYNKLSVSNKQNHNKEILKLIASDELKHYNFWKKLTGKDVLPDKIKIWKYFLISKIFGLTFGLKLMERGEQESQEVYERISKILPDSKEIIKDEEKHELELISLINEEKLKYVGSVVLGLNDALVELTGALAGFTFALQNNRLIATVGLITGIAASLSMAASEYLSTKSEETNRNAVKASIYTGFAYVLTVGFLISPYFIFNNYILSFLTTLFIAILIIFLFNYYVSVAKSINFKKRFIEMAVISLGVSGISFLIGFLVKFFLNIEA